MIADHYIIKMLQIVVTLCYNEDVDRDDEITIVEVDGVTFNGMVFSEIHIPIKHINFDASGNQRSSFTVEQVAILFGEAIDGVSLIPEGRKADEEFFVYYCEESSRMYKFVFRIKSGAFYIHVITLFRTR